LINQFVINCGLVFTAIAINMISTFTRSQLGYILVYSLLTAVSYFFYWAVTFRTSPMKCSTSSKELIEKDQ